MNQEPVKDYSNLGINVAVTFLISNLGLFLAFFYFTSKQLNTIKEKEKLYNVVDSRELKRYSIHNYLYSFLQEKKIKCHYLKKSNIFSDLFKVPQKEFLKEEYDTSFSKDESIVIIVYKSDSHEDKINVPSNMIYERLNQCYLMPYIQFSKNNKNNQLSEVVTNEVMKELNRFLKYHYTAPNIQLNSAINITKSIVYFMGKGVPFATLRLHWNNPEYLILLEKIGRILPNKKFNVTLELKTYDVAFLNLKVYWKPSLFKNKLKNSQENSWDIAIAKEFIQYFEMNPLKDVQISIKDPSLGLASPYCKLIAKSIPKEIHSILNRHITANKNAIEESVLKRHPDLEEFLRKNFIHRYLYVYHHSLYVDSTHDPERIYVMYKGQMRNWDEIKDSIKHREDGVSMAGLYGQQGIMNEKNVFNWKEFTPFICRNESEEIFIKSEKPYSQQDMNPMDYVSNCSDDMTLINNENSELKDILKREKGDDDYDLDNTPINSDNDSDNEHYYMNKTKNMNDATKKNNNINLDTIKSRNSFIKNEKEEKEQLIQSLYDTIEEYKERYQVFSDIYKDTFQHNTKENVEKFLYYDTRINGSKDPYEPNWGNRYIFEYCFWIISQPRLSGDHAFIKLKTPEGKVYSVGLYREFKRSLFDSFIFPLRIKPCKFISPDLSEFWKGYYNTIAVEISKEQFEKIKRKVEEDQSRIDERPYQHIRSNCVTWTQEVAALADIYFPCDYPMTKLIFKDHRTHNITRKIFRSKFLNPYYILMNKIWATIINFLSILLGARRIDKRVKRGGYYGVKPFYTKISDIADIDRVILMHPFIMGYHVHNYISDWRLKQVKNLEERLRKVVDNKRWKGKKKKEGKKMKEILDIKQKLEHLPYRIPEHFRQKQELPEEDLYTKCPIRNEK